MDKLFLHVLGPRDCCSACFQTPVDEITNNCCLLYTHNKILKSLNQQVEIRILTLHESIGTKTILTKKYYFPQMERSILDGLKLKANMLQMHMFACLDLIENSLEVVTKPGWLQVGESLLISVALHEFTTAASLAQQIPSTEGISSLYTPYWLVVLLTEKDICSAVLGETALNLQSILTSAPAMKQYSYHYFSSVLKQITRIKKTLK